jgi:hypothetical protein
VTTAGSRRRTSRKPTARPSRPPTTANAGNGFLSTTDNATLTSTVAGATLQAGQVITLRMPYVCD